MPRRRHNRRRTSSVYLERPELLVPSAGAVGTGLYTTRLPTRPANIDFAPGFDCVDLNPDARPRRTKLTDMNGRADHFTRHAADAVGRVKPYSHQCLNPGSVASCSTSKTLLPASRRSPTIDDDPVIVVRTAATVSSGGCQWLHKMSESLIAMSCKRSALSPDAETRPRSA